MKILQRLKDSDYGVYLIRGASISSGLKYNGDSTRTVMSEESVDQSIGEKKKVRFNEDDNTSQKCRWKITEKHCARVWYNEAEIETFRKEAMEQVRLNAKLPAIESLEEAHKKCQSMTSRHQLNDLLTTAIEAGETTIFYLGLEKWATATLCKNRTKQRQKLVMRMKRLQASRMHPTKRADELRRVSVQISQAGCFFAEYLGAVLENEMNQD